MLLIIKRNGKARENTTHRPLLSSLGGTESLACREKHRNFRNVVSLTITSRRILPRMRRFVDGVSARSLRLDPRPVTLGFMVDKVTLDAACLRVLRHSPASTALSMLHTHPCAYCQRPYNFTTNSLNKHTFSPPNATTCSYELSWFPSWLWR
jgi:hypothetical protein